MCECTGQIDPRWVHYVKTGTLQSPVDQTTTKNGSTSFPVLSLCSQSCLSTVDDFGCGR